jgi:hypothetical protein
MYNVAMELTPTVTILPKYQQNTTLLISFMAIFDKIVKFKARLITVSSS